MVRRSGSQRALVFKHLSILARDRLGGELSDISRLTGGASQEMWSFTVDTKGGQERYVLRKSNTSELGARLKTAGLDTEAQVTLAVAKTGVPVADVVTQLHPTDKLGKGFVARFVEGEALGHRLVNGGSFDGLRPLLVGQCGRILAQIHTIDIAQVPMLETRSPELAVAQLADQLRSVLHPVPMFERALIWLEDKCPAAKRNALVHGDFRTGNLIVNDDGVAAVLDWENAHLGDPMEDLGWFCMPSWRFGKRDQPAGGFGSREALFSAYEKESGTAVEADRVHFWEIYGILRWGLTCIAMAEAFAETDRSIERAAVGRRSSEAEYELARALAPRNFDA